MGISNDIMKQIVSLLDASVDPRTMAAAAKRTAESVKTRTRLGKGVAKDGATLKSLESLSGDYKSARKRFKKQGKLSSKTTPAKSNLTKSGDMLDNIQYKTDKNGFEIFIKGKDNQDKAEYVQKKRPFMYLASFEIKLIVETIFARIQRAIKK